MKTLPRSSAASALLVGMDDKLAGTCTLILRAVNLSVLRAAHMAAACERIPIVQPRVVVLPVTMKADATEAFNDCAVAVGASVVWIDEGVEQTELIQTLVAAVGAV